MVCRILCVCLLVVINTFVLADGLAGPDSPPPEPSNLRAQTYSSTAIELFWDRVPNTALSYEVSINGALEQTNQGTSYFTNTLAAGQAYAFSVVAIDSHGQRSAVNTITASTLSDPNAPPPVGPEAPANPRLVVYSQTAAELFWDRAPTEQKVVTTEIHRNGLLIGMAEGNSFFDNTREPSLHYEYKLTAIDSVGGRSSTSVLIEQPDTPIINRDNYTDIVSEVLATYHGGSYDLVVTFKDWVLGSFIQDTFPDTFPPAVHACDNGGTANFFGIVMIDFSDCQTSEFFINGPFSYNPDSVSYFSTRGEALSIMAYPETSIDFQGTFEESGLQDYGYSAALTNLALRTPTDTLILKNLNTDFDLGTSSGTPNTFTALMSGAFDIQSTSSGGELIHASTLEDFYYSESVRTHSESWNYRKGILHLRARDNSQVVLSADTGDNTTVAIKLYNEDGVEEFIQPWSSWYHALRRE